MTRALVLCAVLAACGPRKVSDTPRAGGDAGTTVTSAPADAGPPDAPRALADDLPLLALRSAELLEALGDALAGGGDCAALATAAREVFAEHRDTRVAQAAVADRGAGADLDLALGVEQLADRIHSAAARMRPALKTCARDADFNDAMIPLDVP